MRYFLLSVLTTLLCLPTIVSGTAEDSVSVHRLTVEYMKNPVGVEKPHPRLSWQLFSNRRGTSQQAYQIIVASTPEKLDPKRADLWNSGRISSDQNVHVRYKGDELDSYEDCYWKVRIWDDRGKRSGWSETGRWKMGLLDRSEWKGRWIGSNMQLKPYQDTLRALADFERVPRQQIWQWSSRIRKMTEGVESAPAVYLRREFASTSAVKEAYVSISGLGVYELFINGERIGNYLNPAYTDYEKRVLYNTYEVTDALNNGENAVGVILGNGWYNLVIPHALRYYAADYIAPPKLLMELRITYEDGTTRTISTDTNWQVTTEGPIRFNDVLGGETHDARKKMADWTSAGYDDSDWQSARDVEEPKGEMDSQLLDPVQKIDTLQPARISTSGDTVIVDFGKELKGWVRMQVTGERGDTVTVHHPGAPQHTLGRYQVDTYILDGDPETFEPRFSYKGFRKLVITGLEYVPEPEDFSAIRVLTNLPRAGQFASSNEKLNKLQEITRYTIENYNVHLPNDPTREKAAWTQDAQNAFDAVSYNFHGVPMYQKWQQDLLDIQYENGYVPPVAPGRFDGHHINGPWWGGMIVYLPWKLYRYYGDRQMLRKSYPAMRKYVGYLESIADSNIVRWGLGDWREPGTHRPQNTPVELTSTVAYYQYTRITAATGEILGDTAEAEQYREKADTIKRAYNARFYDGISGRYGPGSQASQILSLYFDLVPESEKEKVQSALVRQIRKDSLHLSTGFVATPYLLQGLTEAGYPEMAYTVATQETYPGWFDMTFNRKNRVLKESWRGGGVQMPSLAGNISWYFYRSLAGIRPAQSAPGFKHFIIDPAFIDDLEWVRASYESNYGTIVSHWKSAKDALRLEVEVPANTRARIHLPAADPQQITESGQPVRTRDAFELFEPKDKEVVLTAGSGRYNFRIDK